MSIYTTNEEGRIYFLNDKNIASGKAETSCAAGFNAVASQDEFVEAYGEFGLVSSDLYKLCGDTQLKFGELDSADERLDGKIDKLSADAIGVAMELSAEFAGRIEDVSAAASRDFLHLDGGGEVSGSVKVYTADYGRTAIEGGSVTVSAGSPDNAFRVVGVKDVAFDAEPAADIGESSFRVRAGGVHISAGGGFSGVTVNGESLASKFGELSANDFSYDSGADALILQFGGQTLSVDASKFVLDNVIEDVAIRPYTLGDGETSSMGMFLTVKLRDEGSGGGEKTVSCDVSRLVDVYKASGDGIVLSDDGQTFCIDWDKVGSADDVRDALSASIFTAKFIGHVVAFADDGRGPQSLSALLQEGGVLDEQNRIKNGAMVEVAVYNSSDDHTPAEYEYVTSDEVPLGHGDYIVVHKHGFDPYVRNDELAYAGPDKTVYLLNAVHRYDVFRLRDFVVDNFAKLSGNNDISADNRFWGSLSVAADLSAGGRLDVAGDASVGGGAEIGGDVAAGGSASISGNAEIGGDVAVGEALTVAEGADISGQVTAHSSLCVKDAGLFENTLSVGFDKLADLSGDGKTLAQLCSEISGEIVKLSGEFVDVSADLYKLSGEFETVSSDVYGLSGEFEAVSSDLYSLSGDFEAVSSDLYGLSGEFVDVSADLYKLSGEFETVSSDVYGLSGEVADVSAALSAEVSARAQISVDGTQVQEFMFEHVALSDYHALVLEGLDGTGPGPLSNVMYVTSSDNMVVYGGRVIEMADGVDEHDAVTVGQLSTAAAAADGKFRELRDAIVGQISAVLSAESVEDNLPAQLSSVVQCLVGVRDALRVL